MITHMLGWNWAHKSWENYVSFFPYGKRPVYRYPLVNFEYFYGLKLLVQVQMLSSSLGLSKRGPRQTVAYYSKDGSDYWSRLAVHWIRPEFLDPPRWQVNATALLADPIPQETEPYMGRYWRRSYWDWSKDGGIPPASSPPISELNVNVSWPMRGPTYTIQPFNEECWKV